MPQDIETQFECAGRTDSREPLATGVGRRFLIDLEAGKSSCQLGRSLLVAEALGVRSADILASAGPSQFAAPDLPDLAEEAEEPDEPSTRLL